MQRSENGKPYSNGAAVENANNHAHLALATKRFDSAARPYRIAFYVIRVSSRLQLSKPQQLQALPSTQACLLPTC